MENKNSDTHPTINTLKGIAISAVLINHYLNLNLNGVFPFDATGFASAFIAIFYIVSGYGLYYSLSNIFPNGAAFSKIALFRFYRDRAVRIFPLFWIALLTFKIYSIKAFLGINAPDVFWFIPTLLQCYIIAPFIYMGMRRNVPVMVIIIIMAFIIINLFPFMGQVGQLIIKQVSLVLIKWRGLYLGYMVLFACGLLIPYFIYPSQATYSIYVKLSLWFHLVLVIGFIVVFKYYISNKLLFLIMPLPILVLLVMHAVMYGFSCRFLAYLGSISYSLYLFHIIYYGFIYRIGFTQSLSMKTAICIILFPLFLYVCNKTEGVGKYIAQKLRLAIEAGLRVALPAKYET